MHTPGLMALPSELACQAEEDDVFSRESTAVSPSPLAACSRNQPLEKKKQNIDTDTTREHSGSVNIVRNS